MVISDDPRLLAWHLDSHSGGWFLHRSLRTEQLDVGPMTPPPSEQWVCPFTATHHKPGGRYPKCAAVFPPSEPTTGEKIVGYCTRCPNGPGRCGRCQEMVTQIDEAMEREHAMRQMAYEEITAWRVVHEEYVDKLLAAEQREREADETSRGRFKLYITTKEALDAMEAERDHWKANHEDVVRRKRVVDLEYKKYRDFCNLEFARNDRLLKALDNPTFPYERKYSPMCGGCYSRIDDCRCNEW